MVPETFATAFESLAVDESSIALLGLVAGGLLCCFFGYRATKFLLDAAGFIVFGLTAALVAGIASDGNLMVMGIVLLVAGIVGGVLAHVFFRMGMVLLGGGAFALLAWNITALYDNTQLMWIITVVAGVSGGLLALFLVRLVISLASAVIGGWFSAYGTMALLANMNITPQLPDAEGATVSLTPVFVAWLALAGAGFVFQLIFGKRKKDG